MPRLVDSAYDKGYLACLTEIKGVLRLYDEATEGEDIPVKLLRHELNTMYERYLAFSTNQ